MLKKSASENGSFNPRVFLAFVLASFGLMFGMISFASTPSSGTLSEATPVLNYTAGPFLQSNPVPVPLLQSGPTCTGAQPCDSYSLKVSLSATYANSGAAAKVTLSWNDTGSGSSDYDLYLYEGTVTNTSSGTPVASRSASSGNPEVASIFPLNPGDNTYTIKVVPYVATGETINVKIELLAGSGGASGFPGFGQADPTVPGQPRYQTFFPPSASNAESGSGEMNVGFNPKTGRFMLNNAGPVWRVTPPEVATAGAPECCEAKWEDRSSTIADKGVDPILWTDQTSGRTFASNFTGGANALYAYTDSDGEPTVTSPTGWVVLGAAVPNGSADHQTIGSGPYPSGSALANLANQGQAVYYCSQAVVGPATCQRSDDLGASYGPGTLAYTGSGCGGLHGHIRVGPDGTAYLPVPDCGGQAGVAVSTDAGITWKEFYLPNSLPQASGSDSSIAIDKDNNLYYFYIVSSTDRKQGTMHVQVGRKVLDATGQLIGITWSNDHDLGASHGIVNSAFPEAIAGDSGRAAVGFLGTDRPGDFQSLSFPGYWYAFMSTTFDGGKTWVTTNVSPNDPVQGKGGIWQQGGSATNRNLLDFNEITIDSKGRPGFAYSDGCVGECVGNPDANSFTAHMRLARQIGGRTLFASEDANTDTTVALLPEAPCLSGRRDQFATHLTWKAPDNGGSEITNYEVYRGTSPGGQKILLGNAGAKSGYTDSTAGSSGTFYYTVRAQNSQGFGPQSNEVAPPVVALPPPETACTAPGLTKLTDASGDGIIAGSDLKSFQIAQPYQSTGENLLTFTINTDPGQAVQPLGSAWFVSMKKVNGATTTYKGVRMVWNGATPTFESYTPSPNSSGTVDGRFVAAGSQKPAASGSYAPPYDKIVITVNAADLGLSDGSLINGFVSGVSQPANPTNTGANASTLYDQMPNSLAYTGGYTVDSQACRPNTPPTAAMSAVPTSGTAPLLVSFDGSASTDSDTATPADTIASYTFDFGDGTSSGAQSSPSVSHTYATGGSYTASLTVTDSRGAVSTNSAQATIAAAPPQPDLDVTNLVPSNNQAKQGDKITFTATIKNVGQGSADVSNTEFILDGTTVLGTPNTSSLAPGSETLVSVQWQTTSRTPKGNHKVVATADINKAVAESDEGNNAMEITIFLQGNKTR